jgi:L-threonylcarbamoyladenylate synthase
MTIKTAIIKIDSLKPQPERISKAAKFIQNGGVVVFPTETVYGIGANAFDDAACKKIFEIKGRPADNPLIVHVYSLDQAVKIAHIENKYLNKIKKIWPSPITFIAKARADLPKSVTAGLDTVAIRMPAHPVALSLIKKAGVPIAAPSANPSQKPTATTGSQCIKYFDRKVDCIIDSGSSFFGLESTIIDLRTFTLLRPGPFTPEEIETAFSMKPHVGKIASGTASAGRRVISPGTKYRHYAPETPLFMFEGDERRLSSMLESIEVPFAIIGSSEMCAFAERLGCSTVSMGSRKDLYNIAKNLYSSVILLDSLKVKFGIVESFEQRGVGLAIMNRLRKASANKSFSTKRELLKLL